MSHLRAGATALACLLAVATIAAGPARAQEETTSTSTTSTLVDPGTLVPPESTTSTAPPPADDPAAHADAPSETVPPVSVTVPPREPTGTGPYAGQGALAASRGRIVRVSARTARAQAAEAQAVLDAAVARREMLAARRFELRDAIARLAVEERQAIEVLEAAQLAMQERAASAYIRGNSGPADALLMAETAAEYGLRVELLQVVVEADGDAVAQYRSARRAVDREQLAAAEELATVSRELLSASDAVENALREYDIASRELAVTLAGGSLVIHGFAFPVADPHTFGDSFGAPRMMGTEYEHWHEGTDIMAPMGTLLLASERGVILRIGSGGVLGGNTVWLRGESDVSYYYAHLSGFAPGLREGMVVDAGTVLGFVGDSGNARGGAPHVHFEVHPNGGAAINPYPILAVADDQQQPEPIWIQPP